MPCKKCEPFGGLWQETPKGLKRCDCSDGRRLSEPAVAHKPVLTPQQTEVFISRLAALPFFPSEPGTRAAIGIELRAMCGSVYQADWLVRRMMQLYTRWPGPSELRRVLASRHVPWDGVQPLGISEFYPDGIPSEKGDAPGFLKLEREEARRQDRKLIAGVEEWKQ